MKTAVEQLSTYKSVHLNKKNLKTHFIGIPLIVWSVIVLMSLIRMPLGEGEESFAITFGMMFVISVSIYYFKLHARLAMGITICIIPVLYIAELVAQTPHAVIIAVTVFVIGWIIQFIGHRYEKAKPAFVDDINQLLIGPFFLIAELYFMFGKEKELKDEITPIALQKRKEFEANKKKQAAM